MNIQALDKALRLAHSDRDGAIRVLVDAGMSEDEAKQTLAIAADPRRHAGRV